MTVFLDTPVAAGTVNIPSNQAGSDHGFAVLSQSTTLNQNGTNAVSNTFNVPPYAQILDFLCDTTIAWNSNSGDTLTVGITAGGTTYANSVNVASTGRVRPTFSAAELASMQGVSSNTTVVATVTPSGTAATTGTTVFTMVYVMLPNPNGIND